MIEEDLDAELERQATLEGVSKAALIRRYVGERLRRRPIPEDDPIWGLVGMVEGGPDDSQRIGGARESTSLFVVVVALGCSCDPVGRVDEDHRGRFAP